MTPDYATRMTPDHATQVTPTIPDAAVRAAVTVAAGSA